MTRLFVDAFLVPMLESESPTQAPIYDEERAISLDGAGQPFVVGALRGETHTLTEVRAEHDDRDEDNDRALALDTVTKVAREGSDRADPIALLGTETRQVPGEREDWTRDEELGTRTGVPREADDWARADGLLGTETAVGREPGDRSEASRWSETQTFVRRESTDIATGW